MEKNYTRLTTEQILQCRTNGELMEELLLNTERMVYKIVRKFHIANLELEDMHSIGQFEVYKAVFTYDETKESDFYTYAHTCVYNACKLQLRNSTRKKRNDIEIHTKEDGDEEIVKRVVSLDNMTSEGASILDTLESDSDVFNEATREDKWEFLKLVGLSDSEYEIIQRLHKNDESFTEIALSRGVSRQYINHAYKKALNKIKSKYTKDQLINLLGL